MKEFITRTFSAAIMLAAVLGVIFFAPPLLFFAFLVLVVLGAAYELLRLLDVRKWTWLSLLNTLILMLSLYLEQLHEGLLLMVTFTALVTVLFTRKEEVFDFKFEIGSCLAVPFLLGFTLFHLYLIWSLSPYYLVFLIAVISIADTGAYIIGRLIGRHPVFPTASPRKTWEGFFAGLLSGVGGGVAVAGLLKVNFNLHTLLMLTSLTVLAAQISDPFESLFKRAKGVKDSSAIIPGHGGILDRLDSYILAGGVFFYLLRLVI